MMCVCVCVCVCTVMRASEDVPAKKDMKVLLFDLLYCINEILIISNKDREINNNCVYKINVFNS